MLKVALIGCGRISKNHIIALAANSETTRLVAVCDKIEEKANVRKNEYFDLTKDDSVLVYTDYKKMINDIDLDFVAIATESGYHYEQSMNCFDKSISVLVEKPMALSVEHAQKMIDTARNKGLKLGVSFQNRFNPPIQELRKAIELNRFGKVYAISANILWNRGKHYYEQAPWRGTYELDGGALMNQCIHNIDLLQWMSNGNPQQINAMLENYNHDYLEVEDYGSIQVRFDNGVIGNIQGTVVVSPRNYKENLIVLGEKGTVEISGLAVNEVVKWNFEDGIDSLEKVLEKTKNEILNVYGNGHTPLYTDFIQAVKTNTNPYISGEEGIKSLKIILGAYDEEGVGNGKRKFNC